MLCILQARMSSTRLPSKMLLDLKGRVVIGRVLDRLKQAKKVSKTIVATSDGESDQPLADFCIRENVECVRGSLEDVTGRFRQVVAQEQAEAFVRITGDSPLIDPEIVDRAVGYFEQAECDLVTNVLTRTFPKGQSVEAVLSSTFMRVSQTLMRPDLREHVTKIYHENPTAFRIVGFSSGQDFGQMNLSLDTSEDFARIEAILERAGDRPAGWRELAAISDSLQSG